MKLYKYTFKSPLTGSIYCEDLFSETCNRFQLNETAMARLYNDDYRLSQFLEDNMEDMTEYLEEDLKRFVHKMEVGDYGVFNSELCLLAHVWTTTKITDSQVQEVMDYISGQYSDGWGEGLEQREWREDRVDIPVPYFDPQEGDWAVDEDYTYAYFYVHPWNSQDFSIQLQFCEEEEIPDPEPVVQSARCELMPSGGYKVRTVYRFDTQESALNQMKNSGLLYSDEFYSWMANFGTYGENCYLYLVVVNEGWKNMVLPILGVLYKDSSRANLFSIDAESGEVNLEEYMESESADFFKGLTVK